MLLIFVYLLYFGCMANCSSP